MPRGPSATSRRQFFGSTAAAATAGLSAAAAQELPSHSSPRLGRVRALRVRQAELLHAAPVGSTITNGDEDRYPSKINSFSKTLRKNVLGEPDRAAYDSMIRACESGRAEDFEAILRGGPVRLKNPGGAFSMGYVGLDQSQFTLPPAPRFDSAEQAAEMVELYWMSLLRDVPFAEYGTHPDVAAAAAELSRLGGGVTAGSIFRGPAAGALTGPFVSQFLLQPVHFGTVVCEGKQTTAMPGVDYMTQWSDWFSIQIGENKGAGTRLEPNATRYVRNGRDLAHFVHYDWSYSPFYQALWTLLSYGERAYTENNPLLWSRGQEPYINFGAPDAFDFVARAAKPAFQAAWWQKWRVHRRARPEEFGGRVHQNLEQVTAYPIHRGVMESEALRRSRAKWGTGLLAQAYGEGCPGHSAYPSGHATVSGACITMLKAFFRDSFIIPNPVVASADGTRLEPYSGPPLTVGGELDKLAYNIAGGRNFAGIHWRSDMVEGVRLGERVATEVLRDVVTAYDHDDFGGLRYRRVDGSELVVGPGSLPIP